MFKKSFSFIIIIFILLLFYQIGVNYFKDSHVTDYINKSDGVDYRINEKYIKKENNDYYLIKVNYQDKEFTFDVDNHFNKQPEIVKKVHLFNNNNILCLALDYKNNVESSTPLCYMNNEFVSFNIARERADFSEYISKLENTKYDEKNSIDKDNLNYEDISVNLGYLGDENVLVYSFKRIVLINKNRRDYFVFSNYDIYKNTYGYVLNKYYIIPKLTGEPTIDQFIVYNIENGITKDIELKESISKQLFINGDYDNKMYFFDKSNLKQYSLDPEKLEVIEVSNKDKEGIIYKNGKEQKISVYELNKDLVFTPDLEKYRNLNYNKIYENPKGKFFVYEKDGKYYKVYKNVLSNPILLLENKNITNFTVNNEDIFYLEGTTIFRHNKYGKFPIISRNEFKFNSERIFSVYIK